MSIFWTVVVGVLWSVGLVMLPAHTNGFWTPKMVAWLLGGVSLISLQSWALPGQARRRSAGSWWLAALLCWVWGKFLLTNCWPWLWLTTTADRFPYHFSISTIIPTLTCVVSLLTWRALVQATDTPQRWARVGWHVCAYATVLAVYGLVQCLGLDPLLWVTVSTPGAIGKNLPITVFGNPMLTANTLAICAPLCLAFKPRWCRVSYLLAALVVVLSHSATSLIALLLGSSLMWGFRRQWRWLAGAWGLAVLGVGWMAWTHQLTAFLSLSGRWEMWTHAFQIWKQQPLFAWVGYSLGAVEAATANNFWNYGSLHCEPVQVAFELGLIGLAICIGVAWNMGRRVWRAPKDTLLMGWVGSALSYAVVSCASFPLRIGSLLMLGVLIVASLEALTEESSYAYPA